MLKEGAVALSPIKNKTGPPVRVARFAAFMYNLFAEKPYGKQVNCTMKTIGNQVVMPLNVAKMIDESDSVFKMAEILSELDYQKLRRTYRRHWRSIAPEIMFSIVVFAYMKGIFSSRGIEEACSTDIRFMWLLQYHKAPDHTTISRFLENNMSGCAEDLFYQLIEKLAEMGEIDFEALFVDGTKIEANANRYSFVWAKAVEKRLKKLNEKVKNELPSINTKYGLSDGLGLESTVKELKSLADIQGISFVHGKGKHKTQLQRDCERLEELLSKGNEYIENLRICGKRKSYSKTDPDATFMRMKEDHMRNGQLKPGYNLQIGVSGEYIAGLGLFPNPTDTTTLIPFLERMKAGLDRSFRDIVADMGYSSEENYTYLESNNQTAYIKPADHEIKKTRKHRNNIFHKDNMPYDEANDRFTCPNGKHLIHSYDKDARTDNGYTVKKSCYVCESCAGCPFKDKCFKGQYENRRIELSKTMRRQKEEAEERISTGRGILLRMNRSIQVEGAFGVLKQDYGFRRFLTRGKKNNETRLFILAMAFNIQKLCSRIANGRFGRSLFEIKAA